MMKLALRTVLYRRGRLLLTTLSIVLGVGFMSATLVFSASLREGADQTFESVATNADLLVRRPAPFDDDGTALREPLPGDVLDTIRSVEGVQKAVGAAGGSGLAGAPDPDGWTSPAIIYSADGLGTLSPFEVKEGRPPQGVDEAVIDAATAQGEGLDLGDQIAVQSAHRATMTIVGIGALGDVEGVPGQAVVLVELPAAQDLLGRGNTLDEILVAVGPGTRPGAVGAAIQKAMDTDVEVSSTREVADERADDAGEAGSMVSLLLGAFAVIALFVGGLVILNTFTVIMAQRTRETGLLRAVGASSRQVTRAVLVEAAIVGTAASILGAVAGIGMAAGLRVLTERVDLKLPDGGLVITSSDVAIPAIIGIVLTVVASYIPARRAGRLTPMAALRDLDRRVTVGRVRIVIGIILAALAAFAGTLGMVAAMAAAALLAPAIVPALSRVALPLLRHVGGMAGRLGAENARRNPIRTGATASALMIGMSLVVGMTVVAASMLTGFQKALDHSVQADLIVSAPGGGMSPDLADAIAELPEVETSARQRYGSFELVDIDAAATPEDSGTQELAAVDAATYADTFDLGVTEGAIDQLGNGGVVVLDDIATRQQWELGDKVPMRFAASGVEEFTVVGIYTDDTLESQGFMIGLEDYERLYSTQLDLRILVNAAPGTDAIAAQQAVEEVAAGFPGVRVDTAQTFMDEVTSIMDILLSAVNVLLGLAVVIAVLGIVNTLALSLHERTRELGLVRAVGMSDRQVRAMVRWESLVMSLLGTTLALAVGAVVGRALLTKIGGNFAEDITYPLGRLALLTGLGIAVGIGAAVLPARRAARTPVLDAVRVRVVSAVVSDKPTVPKEPR